MDDGVPYPPTLYPKERLPDACIQALAELNGPFGAAVAVSLLKSTLLTDDTGPGVPPLQYP